MEQEVNGQSEFIFQWTSKSKISKHALHPTFTHGSTLGLYEVLNGKPYICDMITDSVVLCFFIEAKKVLSMLRSELSMEDFFWQESVIVLSKILLPQVFEQMAMQDMRALIAERSRMITCIRGETIELPPNFIGFLLEGFVKSQDLHQELITSPVGLSPQKQDSSRVGLEGSGILSGSLLHQGSYYYVETRAKVIMFDIAAFRADNAMQRRPSSYLLHSGEHPTHTMSKEHSGLLSWPEQHFKQGQHHQKGVWLVRSTTTPISSWITATELKPDVLGVSFDPFWIPPSSDDAKQDVMYRFGSVDEGGHLLLWNFSKHDTVISQQRLS